MSLFLIFALVISRKPGLINQISTKSTIIMKKSKTKQLIRNVMLFLGIFSLLTFTACREDEELVPDPVASFQYEIDEIDFLKVTFENYSKDAVSYNWNFGDGQTSTEENPTHTYASIGNYNVVLVATNSANVTSEFSETIEVKDPNEALTKLTGQTSKTWKLYRVDNTMGVGPNQGAPYSWWSLQNDGSRPCAYLQEVTFHRDGKYEFDHKGVFWGEHGVWGGVDGVANTPLYGTCFEAIPANMKNVDGTDVSAWLTKTHAFTYAPATNMVTLNGLGAWIGLPKVATGGEVRVPQQSVSFKIEITEHTGYDLMEVWFIYEWGVWKFNYVNYSNPALEPALVEAPDPVVDLEKITPTVLGHTFESATSFDLLGDIGGGVSIITPGVDDPANASATKVGKFERTADQFQEAQLRVAPDPKNILFTNFTKVSLDVYLPASNNYDPLTKKVIIGFGDRHTTNEWWTRLIQYESAELALDQWVTVTFELDKPSFANTAGETVFDREDLDMVFIQIGGGNHTTPGTFYIRNLKFE
jgi:PKD repeat protein